MFKGNTQPRFALKKVLLTLVFVISLSVCALFGGWTIFIGYALTAEKSAPKPADAIVVVTGGAGRLERAIELLKEGKGKKTADFRCPL